MLQPTPRLFPRLLWITCFVFLSGTFTLPQTSSALEFCENYRDLESPSSSVETKSGPSKSTLATSATCGVESTLKSRSMILIEEFLTQAALRPIPNHKVLEIMGVLTSSMPPHRITSPRLAKTPGYDKIFDHLKSLEKIESKRLFSKSSSKKQNVKWTENLSSILSATTRLSSHLAHNIPNDGNFRIDDVNRNGIKQLINSLQVIAKTKKLTLGLRAEVTAAIDSLYAVAQRDLDFYHCRIVNYISPGESNTALENHIDPKRITVAQMNRSILNDLTGERGKNSFIMSLDAFGSPTLSMTQLYDNWKALEENARIPTAELSTPENTQKYLDYVENKVAARINASYSLAARITGDPDKQYLQFMSQNRELLEKILPDTQKEILGRTPLSPEDKTHIAKAYAKILLYQLTQNSPNTAWAKLNTRLFEKNGRSSATVVDNQQILDLSYTEPTTSIVGRVKAAGQPVDGLLFRGTGHCDADGEAKENCSTMTYSFMTDDDTAATLERQGLSMKPSRGR